MPLAYEVGQGAGGPMPMADVGKAELALITIPAINSMEVALVLPRRTAKAFLL